MSNKVQAAALSVDVTQASTASETVLQFKGHDAFNDSTYWIDVRPYVRITAEFKATGAASCDFTVEALTTENSTAFDLLAPVTVASATVDKASLTDTNIEHVSFVRVLITGTDTQSQFCGLVAK